MMTGTHPSHERGQAPHHPERSHRAAGRAQSGGRSRPLAPRAVRRARESPRSTSTPTASRRFRCGTRLRRASGRTPSRGRSRAFPATGSRQRGRRHPRDDRPVRQACAAGRRGRDAVLRMDSVDPMIAEEIRANARIMKLIEPDGEGFLVPLVNRGTLKQELMRIGYPVKDEAPLASGERLAIVTARRRPIGPAVQPARLPEGGGEGVRRRGAAGGRLRHRRPALRVRQDRDRDRGHGERGGQHADPRAQRRRRAPVDRRDPRQDLDHGGPDRRVHRRPQGGPADHDRDLPDPHLERVGRRRVPSLPSLPRAVVGPRRLRRGAPAAGPGLPRDRRDPGGPPPRAHRHARARGREGRRRLHPRRSQALRRAVEGAGGQGLDRGGALRGGARGSSARACAWSTRSPTSAGSSASPRRTRSSSRS